MNLNTHKTLGSCTRKLSELGSPDDVCWGDTTGILLMVQCWCCFCDTVIAPWENCNWVRIRQCVRAFRPCDIKEQGCSKSQGGLSGSAFSWPVWSCSLNRKKHLNFIFKHPSEENQTPLFKQWWSGAALRLGVFFSYNNLGCSCHSTWAVQGDDPQWSQESVGSG